MSEYEIELTIKAIEILTVGLVVSILIKVLVDKYK